MSRFSFKPSSTVVKSCLGLLISAPLVACSQEAPDAQSHLGTYSSSRPDVPYIKIYQDNGVDYVISPWGGIELLMLEEGKFRSKDRTIGLKGEFSQLNDGVYQSLTYTIYGEEVSLERAGNLQGAELVEKMYLNAEGFENISSVNSQCTNRSLPTDFASDRYDQAAIDRLVETVNSSYHSLSKTTSVLVAHKGELVIEEYMNGWTADYPHTIQAISKSLASLTAGALVEEGKLVDEHQTIKSLLPDYSSKLTGDKAELTLKHFLTMSAGLKWDEWSTKYSDDNNSRKIEMESPNAVQYVLSQELVEQPGQKFVYNGGLVTTLGQIIEEHSGSENAGAYLASGPLSNLCFENAYMHIQNDHTFNFAGGGYLRSRDLLKLGLLVQNQGMWNGQQIIDKQWLENSLKEALDTNWNEMRYGYYWWMQDYIIDGQRYDVVYGLGYGGQVLAIVDELDLVAVRTARDFASGGGFDEFLRHYVIPAFAAKTDGAS
ncbi:class C beta-lactamase-related serine hydrolase [Vibrio sp. T187]|uniref:serine hydrolase domain-containing protein n=1 Tax=Vibrio TaxID=662 RepID=UPI0010C97414|nr:MULTISPECIES: serine hydrolase [Vibrio]MBW3695061.1 class C beta-lactamase-related serine hydrolase [Vibrio sp. T187]